MCGFWAPRMWPVQVETCWVHTAHRALKTCCERKHAEHLTNRFKILFSCWNVYIFDIVGKIKYILDINFTCFFLLVKNTAVGKFSLSYTAPVCGLRCIAAGQPLTFPGILQEVEEEKQKWRKELGLWFSRRRRRTTCARVAVVTLEYITYSPSFFSFMRTRGAGGVASRIVFYCLIHFLSILTLIPSNYCIVISVSNLKWTLK